jgi:hypothetical protein
LNSSVLKWPNKAAVDGALRRWAAAQEEQHPELLRLGYFGSYARGDWGVGSDLDLVAIVGQSQRPFDRRANDWDLSLLPVPTEMLVYTQSEWLALQTEGGRFARTLAAETVWI